MTTKTRKPWTGYQDGAEREFVPEGYTRSEARTIGFLDWYEENVEAGQGLGTVIDFYCSCRRCEERLTVHTCDSARWWMGQHIGHGTTVTKARGVNPYDKPRVGAGR